MKAESTEPRPSGGASVLLWPALALGGLLLFNLVFTEGFFALEVRDGRLYGVLVDILNHGSKLVILALGMTLVIAIGGVDLSVGAVMALAGAAAAVRINAAGAGAAGAVATALGIAVVAGLGNGVLVAVLRIQPIVATLVLMVAGRGVAQLITGGRIVTFTDPALVHLGSGAFLGLPFPVVLAAGLLLGAAVVVRKTAVGLLLSATGDNPAAARAAGIDSRRLRLFAYAFAGLCAGVAGLVAASNIRAADANNAGLYLELDAILAVVIGGTALTGGRFSLLGSVLGALAIQTLTTTLYMQDVSSEIAPVPKALAILLICLLHSRRIRDCSTVPGTGSAPGAELKSQPILMTAAVVVATAVAGGLLFRGFWSARVAVNLLGDGAMLGVASIGATFVILSGGIDLSAGAVMALTGIVIARSVEHLGVHPLAAIPGALAMGAAFGAAQGLLIHRFRLPPFLVTLAGMFLARGLAFAVHPQSLGLRHPFYVETVNETLALDLGDGLSLPFTATTFLVLLAAAFVVLRSTRFGRYVHALGDDEAAAHLLGVPIGRTKVAVYAIAGLGAATAGVTATFYTQSGDPASFVGFELDAIAAVVIGGTLLRGGSGSVLGTFLGVLLLGLIQTLITFHGDLSSWWTRIAAGLLLLLFLALQRTLTAAAHLRGLRRPGLR